MAVYIYKAITKDGKQKKDTIEANSQQAALSILKDTGIFPIEIIEQSVLQKDIKFSFGNVVKVKDLVVFCRQFVSIIGAGIDILSALNLMREQTENKILKKTIGDLQSSIEKGESLAKAMSHHSNIFPVMLINMVEAGEQSGNLDVAFERMALHFEKERKLKQTVKKAVTYPIIVSVVSVIVVFILVTVVIPTFAGMFDTIGMELPVTTKILLTISNFFKNYWHVVLLIIIGSISGIYYYSKTEEGKDFFGKMALSIPLFGKLNTKVAASRFSRTLSTLLTSGISLLDALDMVAKIVGNTLVAKHILDSKENVSRGVTLSTPLKEAAILPPMVTHMVKIGEDTGELEIMLNKVADFYDEEVETSVTQLTTILEPAIIIILAIVVGFLVISIVQPMFQMYNGINQY